jgi:heme o synthase
MTTSTIELAAKPRSALADRYELTKPRMNMLVVATTAVGFFMAARTHLEWMRLPATLIGTAFCAAGASVLNQFIERRRDALMPRTQNRPLPAGRVNPR